jgi:hypothetical protein
LKGKIPSEHWEQVQYVSWFRKTYKGVLIFATPNGGSRNVREAVNLKAEGTTAGIPDLQAPEFDLFVEMKRQKGGRLSQAQKQIIEHLRSIGKTVIVGYGFEDAKNKTIEFMDERNG